MKRRFLTVSELAEACSPTRDDGEWDQERLKIWIRRLRHWSTLGILPADAIRQAEAGRHRLYSADLVYLASVLLRLSGAGISAEVIKSISKELQHETEGSARLSAFWKKAKAHEASDGEHFLLLWIADEGTFVWSGSAICRESRFDLIESFDPHNEPTIMLSLSEIFRGLNPRA
jgi:DNA-binding transcriptional MerR regulator